MIQSIAIYILHQSQPPKQPCPQRACPRKSRLVLPTAINTCQKASVDQPPKAQAPRCTAKVFVNQNMAEMGAGGVVHGYTRKVCGSDPVLAFYINTPNHLHPPIASRMRSLQPESQRKGSAKAGSVPRRLCSVCVRVDVQSRCCVAETEIAWRCVECNAATSVSAVPPVCQQPKVQQIARGQERMFFAAALDPLSSRLRSLAGVWSLAGSMEG